MEIDIVTGEDLRQFKREMLEELKQIIGNKEKDNLGREWLKSAEVRRLLGISPGTLQNLRINGTLPTARWAAACTTAGRTSGK
jgi:hypothetical protein